MHAHIIYHNYLKPDGQEMSIGGIQTYITNLIPILKENGYAISIYQRGTEDFERTFTDFDVYGIQHPDTYGPRLNKALLEKVLARIDLRNDLLIYGCETCIAEPVACRTIAIQHGISWDRPFATCSDLRYLRHYIGKCVNAWKVSQRVGKVDQLVCVDYNFVNWHRAITPYTKTRHIVIPNFSAVPATQPQKQGSTINIIFARRLISYRGTRLFADVAQRLLASHKNISITVAGEGPDAEYVHQKLDSYDNVQFITYRSDESIKIHRDKDIAVIPTIGSEGTSLSLLEAMAAGCAVICTNVGGMTNVVIDGYNGLLVNPDEESLYQALESLIEHPSRRSLLQDNAYKTVKDAFSLEIWKSKWTKVIQSVRA